MQNEIFQRGPIACGIAANLDLVAYTGGIYSKAADDEVDHIVSVVGFGHDEASNMDYWIVRNSWGSHWGENGFFRIESGKNMLQIESGCVWAVPTFTKPSTPAPEIVME